MRTYFPLRSNAFSVYPRLLVTLRVAPYAAIVVAIAAGIASASLYR